MLHLLAHFLFKKIGDFFLQTCSYVTPVVTWDGGIMFT